MEAHCICLQLLSNNKKRPKKSGKIDCKRLMSIDCISCITFFFIIVLHYSYHHYVVVCTYRYKMTVAFFHNVYIVSNNTYC